MFTSPSLEDFAMASPFVPVRHREYIGSTQTDSGSFSFALGDDLPRRGYAAAPQQFPRFRFVHFGQPAQSRTGAQVIAERVFIGGCFPRFPFSDSAIVAQREPVKPALC